MMGHREGDGMTLKTIKGFFFVADGAVPTALVFDTSPPTYDTVDGWEVRYRKAYTWNAKRFVDALQDAAPGGLVDAIFAELATRKASILRVPLGARHGR